MSEKRKVEQHKLFTFIFYFFIGNFSLATVRQVVNKDANYGYSGEPLNYQDTTHMGAEFFPSPFSYFTYWYKSDQSIILLLIC